MDRFQILNQDLLSNIFMRLGFLDLRSVRGTCHQFRVLVNHPDFSRAYNQEGARQIWNFTYIQAEGYRDHWVICVSEDDEEIMTFPLRFNVQQGEVMNDAVELICVWNCILVFHVQWYGFAAFNLWTMRSIQIDYEHAFDLETYVTRLGIRVIEDPCDELHFAITFFHWSSDDDGETVIRFFSHQSRQPQQFSTSVLSTETNRLTAEEIARPLWTVLQVCWGNQTAFSSMRNEESVYMFQPNEAFMGEVQQLIGDKSSIYTCNKGYLVVIERTNRMLGHSTILRIALASITQDLDAGFRILSFVPQVLIPDGQGYYGAHLLRVMGGFVNLSFHIWSIAPDEPIIVILRYNLGTGEWISSSRTIAGLQRHGHFPRGGTYCARLGITPHL